MKKVLLQALLMFLCGTVWAQTRVINGKIADAKDGSPLPGATVTLKGTTTSTSSDEKGMFKINVPTKPATPMVLVVKFIGFQTQELPVTN